MHTHTRKCIHKSRKNKRLKKITNKEYGKMMVGRTEEKEKECGVKKRRPSLSKSMTNLFHILLVIWPDDIPSEIVSVVVVAAAGSSRVAIRAVAVAAAATAVTGDAVIVTTSCRTCCHSSIWIMIDKLLIKLLLLLLLL